MLQPTPKIAVAILSHNRPQELERLLFTLGTQTIATTIVVVDTGSDEVSEVTKRYPVQYHRSEVNLGGAGGFSLAILLSIASGADWVWILDDDACPEGNDCLEVLLIAAGKHELDVVSPIIVAPGDASRLSFPFRSDGRLTYDRRTIELREFIEGTAQFFNGALIKRKVFFSVGLPDMKLFIRGDEVDFMLRLRSSGTRFGTVTSAAVDHPPGWGEVVSLIDDRVALLVPETEFKQYYFFRNRGYLARRHRRLRSFLSDVLLYPIGAYLPVRNANRINLKVWAKAYWDGLSYKFGRRH